MSQVVSKTKLFDEAKRRKKTLLILSHHQFNEIYGSSAQAEKMSPSSIQSKWECMYLTRTSEKREHEWVKVMDKSTQIPLHCNNKSNIQCTLCSIANILSPAVLFLTIIGNVTVRSSIYHLLLFAIRPFRVIKYLYWIAMRRQ